MESRFQVFLLRLAREDVDSIYEWLTERSPMVRVVGTRLFLTRQSHWKLSLTGMRLHQKQEKLPSPIGNVCSELVVEDSTESCSLLWAARCASYACADLASNLSLPTMILRPLKNDAQIRIES